MYISHYSCSQYAVRNERCLLEKEKKQHDANDGQNVMLNHVCARYGEIVLLASVQIRLTDTAL